RSAACGRVTLGHDAGPVAYRIPISRWRAGHDYGTGTARRRRRASKSRAKACTVAPSASPGGGVGHHHLREHPRKGCGCHAGVLLLRIAEEVLHPVTGALEEVQVHQVTDLGAAEQCTDLVRHDFLDGIGDDTVARHLEMELG